MSIATTIVTTIAIVTSIVSLCMTCYRLGKMNGYSDAMKDVRDAIRPREVDS